MPITVYEGIRGDPRASQNFRLFKIFLSHEKKTFSIGDEKLPYFGENQMKSTNLFFYNILHLLINNSRRKIFEKFFFVFFKNLLNFSLFCNLLRLITFYGANHFLWARCQTIANRLENKVTERFFFLVSKNGFFYVKNCKFWAFLGNKKKVFFSVQKTGSVTLILQLLRALWALDH